MRWRLLVLLPVLGAVLGLFALAMSVPLVVSWMAGDGATRAQALAFAATAGSAAALQLAARRVRRELQPRDGFLLVAVVWALLPAYGALPLLLQLPGLSFTDAYFEAVSGLTTTGATVLTGLDALPLSINLWRCLMVWIGGMGILVLTVAILPLLGIGGAQLVKAESAGPLKDEKLTPRMAETARGLWGVYFLLSLACVLAYRAAGMGWAEAFMHMNSTMGLGGFSSHDASFAAFDSPAVETVAIVFMLASGVNFALYFAAWHRRAPGLLWRDVETRAYLALMVGSILVFATYLWWHGEYPVFATALRHAAFSVVSIATTTGFVTVDYAQWPAFVPVAMLGLCCVATCAGSTGGGIKMIRVVLLAKQTRRELRRIVHPRAAVPVTMDGRIVPAPVLVSVTAFMLVWGATLAAATLALLFLGLDPVTAASAAVACLNNTGPGLGQVGPAGNYQGLSDMQTWVCTLAMLLGRLELLSVFVLFTASFWRD